MKKLIFQVSVGKPSKLYTTCINSVAEYCKKYGIDQGVDNFKTIVPKVYGRHEYVLFKPTHKQRAKG